MTTKIFCIGFHQAGTVSLTLALKTLGYRVTGPNGVRDPDIGKNVYVLADSLVKEYDAFKDDPWPVIYKYLDEKYPNSRFILAIRSSESWIKSLVRDFGYHETPMRKWIYGVGCPKGNEEIYINKIEKHNKEVIEYFKERPNDLLVLHIAKGDGWEKLCPFLGASVPNAPFPYPHPKISEREKANSLSAKLIRKAKNLAKRITRCFT